MAGLAPNARRHSPFALFRSTPSSTSAIASIRRDACASRLRAAPARNSPAVRSRRVIAMAADIPASYCPQPRESQPTLPGIPLGECERPRPLV